MGLRLVFLIVARTVSLPGLSRREGGQKDAEILMLRHLRKFAAFALLSVKPGFIVLAVLGMPGIVVVSVVVFTAVYAHEPTRRKDAKEVLETLFGRK